MEGNTMTMEQTEKVDTVQADTAVADPVAPDPVAPETGQQSELPLGDASTEQSGPSPAITETSPGSLPPPAPSEPFGSTQPPAPQVQYTPEQITKMQRDAAQYEQVQMRIALQNQANEYKQQLEGQGFLPEQAEQISNNHMQSQERQVTLMQQAEQYGRHIQEKQLAAEQFVKKYSLGIDDLAALRTHNDPQSMENAAKQMSANRERDAELTRLKQAQVPAQSFDNSQGNPQVAADEGGWLDRYNAGDRSSNAQAAARKAAGLS